eukprot:6107489-Pleurochrysis_carterae.AAC.4
MKEAHSIILALTQTSHPTWRACAKEDGASAVKVGRLRRQAVPAWSRRCRCCAASDGDMTPMWMGGWQRVDDKALSTG